MSEVAAVRRVPRMIDVAKQQVRLIDHAKRFTLMVAVFGAAILIGGGEFSLDAEFRSLFPLYTILIATAAWPLMVWLDEKPSKRTYHRILPVGHIEHDLVKIAAGAFWLMIGLCIALISMAIVAIALGYGDLLFLLTPFFWVNFFTGPLIVYLGLTIVPLLANRPFEWMIGIGIGAVALTNIPRALTDNVVYNTLSTMLVDGKLSLGAALLGGYADQKWNYADAAGWQWDIYPENWRGEFVPATLVWFMIALGLVLLASSISSRRMDV